jgi:hypothetical protein
VAHRREGKTNPVLRPVGAIERAVLDRFAQMAGRRCRERRPGRRWFELLSGCGRVRVPRGLSAGSRSPAVFPLGGNPAHFSYQPVRHLRVGVHLFSPEYRRSVSWSTACCWPSVTPKTMDFALGHMNKRRLKYQPRYPNSTYAGDQIEFTYPAWHCYFVSTPRTMSLCRRSYRSIRS